MPQRRVRTSTVVVLVVIGVIVVGVGVGAVFRFLVDTPELSAGGALSDYAAAISAGDLDRADALTSLPSSAAHPVGGEALATASDRISGVRTTISSESGSTAVGTVSFSLSGTTYTRKVGLTRVGSQLAVLPLWKVSAPLTSVVTLDVPASGTASVNGLDAAFGDAKTVTVYPGRYSVGLGADNRWYSSTAVIVDAGAASVTAKPVVTATDALTAEVTAQVKKAIDACAATASPTPAGCPFAETAVGTLAGFHWTVDEYPTIAFLDPTHVFLQGGQATAHFVLTHSYIVNKTEDDPIGISGTATVSFSGSSVSVKLATP